MDFIRCPVCQRTMPSDAAYCPYCGKPIADPESYKGIESDMEFATGRAWIAVARTDAGQVFLMEKDPAAFLDYSRCQPEGVSAWENSAMNDYPEFSMWDWQNSMVRSYLNGPYLAALPEWIADRLVPIAVEEDGKQLFDTVIIFSMQEWISFFYDTPDNSADSKWTGDSASQSRCKPDTYDGESWTREGLIHLSYGYGTTPMHDFAIVPVICLGESGDRPVCLSEAKKLY